MKWKCGNTRNGRSVQRQWIPFCPFAIGFVLSHRCIVAKRSLNCNGNKWTINHFVYFTWNEKKRKNAQIQFIQFSFSLVRDRITWLRQPDTTGQLEVDRQRESAEHV